MASESSRMPCSTRCRELRLAPRGRLRMETCSRVWAREADSWMKSPQYPSTSVLAAEAGIFFKRVIAIAIGNGQDPAVANAEDAHTQGIMAARGGKR